MNSSLQLEESFKKKVGEYLISFCQPQNYGKSLHGQMRAGYNQTNNKIYIFRISPLPLSNSMQSFLTLQKTFSELKQYARIVNENFNSSSYNYAVLQFFPKTFQSQIDNFRKNTKYFDEMVQKFLKTYSFFFNMKVSHGNLIPSNIGIGFDGKVKLMDFQCIPEEVNEESQAKDFQSFKTFIGRVLQKDFNFPYKFGSFNSPQTQKWEHIFSSWHVTSPLQPVYLSRKNYIQNIVTSLYKLQSSLQQFCQEFQVNSYGSQSQSKQQSQPEQEVQSPFILSQVQKIHDLKMAIRLLQLNYLSKTKQQKLLKEKQCLQEVIGSIQDHDIDYYNSVLIGAIRDFQFYQLDPSRRLFLMSCLIPTLNHEFIFYDIVQQFKQNETNKERNLLLGDSLYSNFKNLIFENLIKKPSPKLLF